MDVVKSSRNKYMTYSVKGSQCSEVFAYIDEMTMRSMKKKRDQEALSDAIGDFNESIQQNRPVTCTRNGNTAYCY